MSINSIILTRHPLRVSCPSAVNANYNKGCRAYLKIKVALPFKTVQQLKAN
jgi:hypothetical protein